jgi:hypothetical protein
VPTDLADRARDLVGRVLSLHRDQLVQLVDEELDRQLGELIEQRLRDRVGDHDQEPPVGNGATLATEPAVLACARCGQEPRLPGRTIGQRCKSSGDLARKRERRTRAEAAAGEEPRPAQAAPPAEVERPARRRRSGLRGPRSEYDRRTAEECRALIAKAPVELIERDGRTFTLRRLPSLA